MSKYTWIYHHPLRVFSEFHTAIYEQPRKIAVLASARSMMNRSLIFLSHLARIILWTVVAPVVAYGEDIDTGIARLSDGLATAVANSSAKKISVVDFSDLKGNTNDLGRYLAEQLSISLVNSARGFSVMDRANLKNLLEEHKLTAEGLVNPENAKKLGQFAGVDAIVLGTITPFGSNLSISAKAISTETTQVIGATRVSISRTKEINALLETDASSRAANRTADSAGDKSTPSVAAKPDVKKNSTKIGDILIRVESVRLLNDKGNTYVAVTLEMTNQNQNTPHWVRISREGGEYFSTFTNRVGQVFAIQIGPYGTHPTGRISGIEAEPYPPRDFTEIAPNSSIMATFRHDAGRNNSDSISLLATPCRFEFILATAIVDTNGVLARVQKNNVFINIE